MKKSIGIFLLILSVLTLSGCKTPGKEEVATSPKQKLSVKEMLSLGKAQKCRIEIKGEGMESIGEIWMKDKKFKQVSTIKNPTGETMVTSVIGDGQWIYSWNNVDSSRGYKFKEEDQRENSENEDFQTTWAEWENNSSFVCEPAIISDSEFNLPPGIKFIELEEELKKIQENVGQTGEAPAETKETQCATCEQLPDEKTALQCRQTLGCD